MAEIEINSGARKRVWVYPDTTASDTARRIQRETNLPYGVCFCLEQRQFLEKEEIRAYLKPDPRGKGQEGEPLPNLPDPMLMKGVPELVDHLIAAKKKRQRILIHGDYDVDGLSSTTLLTRVLREIGFDVVAAVPDRHVDGYGMSMRIIDEAYNDGIRVVLTCDTGISEADKVKTLVERGMTVLITDHHHVPDVIPEAHAVVNPHQKDCAYPFDELCGCGVAFMALLALVRRMGLDEVGVLYKYLDLVALGTICDVVPMVDVNRTLAAVGIRQLQRTNNPGLQALMEIAKVAMPRVSEITCGFILGPRLNAIGRLDNAGIGLDMLLTDDPEEARDLAMECDKANAQRKAITERIEQAAVRQVEAMGDLSDVWALALYGEDWHHGIVGIVASRIVERYGLPAFLFAPDDEGRWKGSGRAPASDNIHLYEFLEDCKPHLLKFGGHAAAAGATLVAGGEETAKAFAEAFSAAAKKRMTPEDRIPKIAADMEIDLGSIDAELYRYLRMFAPFGAENPPVQFIARNVEVISVREMGAEATHLKLKVKQGETVFNDVVGWRMRGQLPELFETPAPYRADLLFQVDENVWKGTARLQLVLVDAQILPDRDLGAAEREDEIDAVFAPAGADGY